MDWNKVWQATERARIELGWTKSEMYERTGISRTAYANMEHGEGLARSDKIHSFVTAFGWTTDDLEQISKGQSPSTPTPPTDQSEVRNLQAELESVRELALTLHRSVLANSQSIRELRHLIESHFPPAGE